MSCYKHGMTKARSNWNVLGCTVAFAGMTLGCNGAAPSLPNQPTQPVQVNEPAAPTVTGIFPNIGSTGGETPLRIAGTGFLPGATVTFGGSTVPTRTDPRDPLGTILYVDSPAHAAGAVDVIVANPTGQPGGMAAGYTYAPPGSFDFNGTWSGFGNAGQDIAIEFRIDHDVLISVSCHTYATVTFSPPLPVSNGEFDYRGDDGVLMSGRIVSESAAVGTLHLAPCTDTRWGARRQ